MKGPSVITLRVLWWGECPGLFWSNIFTNALIRGSQEGHKQRKQCDDRGRETKGKDVRMEAKVRKDKNGFTNGAKASKPRNVGRVLKMMKSRKWV